MLKPHDGHARAARRLHRPAESGTGGNLVIDRDTASRLGISAAAIDNVLYDAFGQREVSTMYTALNQYFVVMEVDPNYQLSPDSLNGIYIKAAEPGGTGAQPHRCRHGACPRLLRPLPRSSRIHHSQLPSQPGPWFRSPPSLTTSRSAPRCR